MTAAVCIQQCASLDDVRYLVRQWGLWARCRCGTEYPSINVLYSQTPDWESFGREPIEITDAQGMRVDRVITSLKDYQYGKRLHSIVFHAYVCGLSQRQLAEKFNCPQTRIREELGTAIGWVAAKINTQVA